MNGGRLVFNTALLHYFLLVCGAHASSVSVVSLNIEQNLSAPRWLYDSSVKVTGTPLVLAMVEAKRAFQKGDHLRCLSHLTRAQKLGKSLAPWILSNRLDCALLKDKKGKAQVAALSSALREVERQPSLLVFGPAVSDLRAGYVSALLALAEAQIKTNRRSAWKTLDKLQQVRSWLSPDERANTYRWAGELAFIEQNLTSAQDFLLRSLSERESAELRAKVESIRFALLGRKKQTEKSAAAAAPRPSVGVSDKELELYQRMNRAFEAQDYVSAIDDGVDLIQRFPGSSRAHEATERVLEIYLSLAHRAEEKFRHVRETIVKKMLKADGGRLNRWAQNAFARGNYTDALNLAETSHEKLAGHPDGTKILLLAGKAALSAGEYSVAGTHLERLLREHAGTPEAAEATFRLGLLEYRRKRYPKAAAQFERLLALSNGREFEYRALYWQWRAQQKIEEKKSAPFAEPLLQKYPLSYYGLRARAELNKDVLELPSKSLAVKGELRLLESERLAWERLIILLGAGWLKEAERELEMLPEPVSIEEKIMRARYWGAALRYDRAMQLMTPVFETNPEYFHLSVLRLIYPEEYTPSVTREAKGSNLSAEWILSLIRQESSYRPEVKSSADAHGLMQLLPATAAELAKDLKVKDFSTDAMMNPDLNIKLGTTYLSRLFRSYKGNMPLALAAYNAGTGRLRRWLGARRDVSPLEQQASSSPDVEIWIDELPWDETSFYVKAVLRNWMVYRLLNGSKVTLNEPIWVDAKPSTR